MAEIKAVGVLGAGLMGHGIAQVVAQAGYDVVLREVDDDRLGAGVGKIEKQLARAVEKGKLEQGDGDAVRATFATSTASLAVVDQAASTSRPERFLGLHFFNPAQAMPLVEVIRAVTTSDDAFQAGLEFAGSLGKYSGEAPVPNHGI